MDSHEQHSRLSLIEWFGLGLLALTFIGFGYLTVERSALQDERKTDFGVYARAAFAVREDRAIYDKYLCDDRGWHYCYPPTFAILMAPLGDPFRWEPRDGYLPFAASVAVWYAINLLIMLFSIHVLISAAMPGEPRFRRRWWYARLMPMYFCLCGLGYTLSRGQVNILVLGMIAGVFVSLERKRHGLTGFWVATAVALKVIPGFLALYPMVVDLRKRGGIVAILRSIIGGSLGLVVLLLVIPAVVWGFPKAIEQNLTFVDAVLAPGALGTGNQDRALELTNATATDSQSFQSVIHTWKYPDKRTRPSEVEHSTRLAHWAISGVMTLLTIATGLFFLNDTHSDRLILLGCFTVVMILMTPVSHMHYYSLVFPLAAGLWCQSLAGRPAMSLADRQTMAVSTGWTILSFIPLLPTDSAIFLRDAGLATIATVALWFYGLLRIIRPIGTF